MRFQIMFLLKSPLLLSEFIMLTMIIFILSPANVSNVQPLAVKIHLLILLHEIMYLKESNVRNSYYRCLISYNYTVVHLFSIKI